MAEKQVSFVGLKEVESDTSGESKHAGVGDDGKQTPAYGGMEIAEENEKNKEHKWKVGDRCKCKYSVDGLFYEANVLKMNEEKGTCLIQYIGYENKEKVPLSELSKSDGEFARVAQIEKCEADEEEMLMTASVDEPIEPTSGEASDSEESIGAGLIPMPPPPPPPRSSFQSDEDYEILSSMLTSWYRSGYFAGFYQATHKSNPL